MIFRKKRQAISQEKGHKIYKSYEEVLADETIEAVLIATPNDLHKDLSIAALKRVSMLYVRNLLL